MKRYFRASASSTYSGAWLAQDAAGVGNDETTKVDYSPTLGTFYKPVQPGITGVFNLSESFYPGSDSVLCGWVWKQGANEVLRRMTFPTGSWSFQVRVKEVTIPADVTAKLVYRLYEVWKSAGVIQYNYLGVEHESSNLSGSDETITLTPTEPEIALTGNRSLVWCLNFKTVATVPDASAFKATILIEGTPSTEVEAPTPTIYLDLAIGLGAGVSFTQEESRPVVTVAAGVAVGLSATLTGGIDGIPLAVGVGVGAECLVLAGYVATHSAGVDVAVDAALVSGALISHSAGVDIGLAFEFGDTPEGTLYWSDQRDPADLVWSSTQL